MFSDILSQLPAWLFIKLSSSSSLSILTTLHSFGLIWIHIISLLGCFLILPKNKNKVLFFPLFAFLTGPLPALGISVSKSLFVCSSVWLAAFVIYYSDLSIQKHRLFFLLAPLPLILSHELISYIAFPLIALCIWKYKNESDFINKGLIVSVIGVLTVCSFLAFYFPFVVKQNISNRNIFLDSVANFTFIYSDQKFNLPIIISLCLIVFLGLYMFSFQEKNSTTAKRTSFFIFVLICIFSVLLFLSLFPLDVFDNFLKVKSYHARVWPPCFALPLCLTLWWFLKEKEISFKNHRWFLLSLIVATVALTSWRIQSDLEFYKHQKEFSKVLFTFQGIVEWPAVETALQNVSLKEKVIYKLISASLLYPRSRTVKAIFLPSYSVCKQDCKKWNVSTKSCDFMCKKAAFGLHEKNFEQFANSRFFDFSLLESETN